MRPFEKTYAPAAADADGLVDGGSGASLTLLASGAGDGLAHRLNFTSAANISDHTFLVTGTDADGAAQTETVTGPESTTVESTKYFLTVTSIVPNATLDSDEVDVGWVDEFVTPTIPMNHHAPNGASFETVVSGTIDYDVQQSLSDLTTPKPWNWTSIPAGLVDSVDLIGITASATFNMNPLPSAVRLVANSYSSSASISFYIVHS